MPTKGQQYDGAIARSRALLAAKFYKESIAEADSAQQLDDSRWEAYAVVSLCLAKQMKSSESAKFASMAVERAPAGEKEKLRENLAPTH